MIDQAVRQLARDSAQQDLAELAEKLVKTATVTPGGFAVSPKKGLFCKVTVVAPAGDPDSSSSSSDSHDISDQ